MGEQHSFLIPLYVDDVARVPVRDVVEGRQSHGFEGQDQDVAGDPDGYTVDTDGFAGRETVPSRPTST